MIDIDRLSLGKPFEASPGSLFIANTRYNRNPIFTCVIDRKACGFDLGPAKDHGFVVDVLATNIGVWMKPDQTRFYADHASTISPTRSEIPFGALCIMADRTCIAIKLNHDRAFVTLSGDLIESPDFENFVAFAKWRVIVPNSNDDDIVIYESDLPQLTEAT